MVGSAFGWSVVEIRIGELSLRDGNGSELKAKDDFFFFFT